LRFHGGDFVVGLGLELGRCGAAGAAGGQDAIVEFFLLLSLVDVD